MGAGEVLLAASGGAAPPPSIATPAAAAAAAAANCLGERGTLEGSVLLPLRASGGG